MTVSDEYADHLKDAVDFGRTVTAYDNAEDSINDLVASAIWEKSDNHGSYSYVTVIENTTDHTFEDVTLRLSLYDADNVKTEAYASTVRSWAPGEKVKFECHSSDVDAQRVVATADHFTTK
ncbi:MAG: FxLYD domain-containing protein [Atopobiaceae bacterium]|nr:FxLYD domain-containing protein [Atopobiaceae bacterium]